MVEDKKVEHYPNGGPLSYKYYWKKRTKQRETALPKLATKANAAYHKAEQSYSQMLDYAKECGDALNEARSYFRRKHVRQWKHWLIDEENFDGSYESAKVYMRIAKKWDVIEKARAEGVTIASIAAGLRLIKLKSKQKPIERPSDEQLKEMEQDRLCAQVCQLFRQALKKDVRNDQMELMSLYWGDLWPCFLRDIEQLEERSVEPDEPNEPMSEPEPYDPTEEEYLASQPVRPKEAETD